MNELIISMFLIEFLPVSRFTETHIACVRFLSGQKRTEFACPAVNFDQLRKNKRLWILHI